ncbi:MAG: cupin domain-containing protein [Sphingobacteriaceae bacterium]|jgi:mannose-6-phosphate isomerase-like protein (cupin superfamily)
MTEKINLVDLGKNILEHHYNDKVVSVNDHCLRIAINNNHTFPWHRHNRTDELFIVLEGNLRIEFENGEFVDLFPNETCCVKSGITHRTIAIGRTVNLCFESGEEDTEYLDFNE